MFVKSYKQIEMERLQKSFELRNNSLKFNPKSLEKYQEKKWVDFDLYTAFIEEELEKAIEKHKALGYNDDSILGYIHGLTYAINILHRREVK